MALWKVGLWIVVIMIADHYVGGWARRTINAALSATVFGQYPEPRGWLYFVDLTAGLALVAYSEEIIFRRCARYVFRSYLGDGYILVFVTSLLFGAYHWWAGFGNIVEAAIIGILLMLFLQRSEALWPVFLSHYLTDILDFA
jgi:membrane protease YdiL (CAAX protease family)